ncbi:amino acid ABC transporter permease [Actinokineospora diospyrosa]|uniref:Polar amino acid transport system permease protein n=1 Tax=Actinokineospora diospyrosa TaxID=103728 RepID=A0ABT1I994_9PSEU|nr:amino acid ABC transporter permease [Actinokineospora diospyrosa]MCP2269187.1 polar amino acid transport system permease protein [Actinokineospora diospyrosa]
MSTETPLAPPRPSRPADTRKRVKAPLHPGWWIGSAIVGLTLLNIGNVVVRSPNLDWSVVGEYFLSTDVLLGLLRTVELTAIAMALGIAGGMLLAVMQLSPVPVVSWAAKSYVWFVRGTPLLVHILFWYNLAALVPAVAIEIPFGPTLFEANTNDLITPLLAAVIALSLNEAAYMAEVVRGGLLSVDPGQREAAKALGMTHRQTLRRVVVPQALRVVIPPTGNQVISMLKASALVSVTSTPELLYSVQVIYNNNFKTIPLLVVASAWYLVVTSLLYVVQHYLERRYSRGDRRG